MVTISSKAAARRRNGRIKLVASSAILLLLILIGFSLLQWFTSSVLSNGSSTSLNTGGIKGSPQSKQRILQSLVKLNELIQLSPDDTKKESIFLSTATKECIPGRDDNGKDINPTTHRKRECLRHVPLGKHITTGEDLEERMKMQRPRIGIMITPGYISTTVAKWIGRALKQTGDSIHMDIEILTTAHVPVYGYGKSHGYSKLIRVVTLPLPLAVNDAYYYSMNELTDDNDVGNNGNDGSFVIQNLDAILDETKLQYTVKPSSQTLGSITELLLRWHCRLSHVAAHTAELTLTLDNILKHPTDTLETILTFVWRQDWEWEGHNHNQNNKREERELYPKIWKGVAEEFVASEDGSLQPLLNQVSLLLSSSTSDATTCGETIQKSFASEMTKSKDLTSWPCPSFWDGVDNDDSGAAHKIANEMTPNCRDGDPYARCTVNKDRCEVKKDAMCK
ncbi:hypothetical protein QTG54_002861 [Skeletonema marinoi]|uniref:Uncharacterized protein n=1 Tax=Skeletonema marinoi TaxID=267567 RepID=A0AAD8YIP3_9STRA|nr:hypothetical protein QTG54_002861 [Skeletonema marinoi]